MWVIKGDTSLKECLDIVYPAEVYVTPSEVEVNRGESFTLTCRANRAVKSFTRSYLTRTSTPLVTGMDQIVERPNNTVSMLTVFDLRRDVNDGQYFCTAVFEVTGDVIGSTGNVIEYAPLVARILPSEYNQVNVGDSLTVQCRVGCVCDAATARWRSEDFPPGLNSVWLTSRADVMTTSHATLDMTGNYTCVASKLDDVLYKNVTLIVN